MLGFIDMPRAAPDVIVLCIGIYDGLRMSAQRTGAGFRCVGSAGGVVVGLEGTVYVIAMITAYRAVIGIVGRVRCQIEFLTAIADLPMLGLVFVPSRGGRVVYG